MSVERDERSVRAVTSKTGNNVDLVRAAVREAAGRITNRELYRDINISLGSVQSMRLVSAMLVPNVLTADQKDPRVLAAQVLLECDKHYENVICTIVTGYNSWLHGYDPKTKGPIFSVEGTKILSNQSGKTEPEQTQVMFTIFFGHKEVVHHEYAPEGQTVNQDYYYLLHSF